MTAPMQVASIPGPGEARAEAWILCFMRVSMKEEFLTPTSFRATELGTDQDGDKATLLALPVRFAYASSAVPHIHRNTGTAPTSGAGKSCHEQ